MINCPSCQSDNVQSYPIAFESGLSDINTKTSGVSFGGAGLNFGKGKTKGKSQTALSQRTAPPRKLSYLTPFVSGIIATIIVSFMLPLHLMDLQYAAFAAVTGGLIFRAYKFNSGKWPALFEMWQKSFICHKCGHTFAVDR